MANFEKFESTIFESEDGFKIRKIKHNVILTYRNEYGEKEFENLVKNTYRLFFQDLEVIRLFPPDEYLDNWLIKLMMREFASSSINTLMIAVITLERIAQSKMDEELSEYLPDSPIEIDSLTDLRRELRNISRALTLTKQSMTETTQWLNSNGEHYQDRVKRNSLRLYYAHDELVRIIPEANNWKLQFIKTDFNASDGIIDDIAKALNLIGSYILKKK